MTSSLYNTVLYVFLCLSPDSVVPDSPVSKASLSAIETAQIAHVAVFSVLSAGCLSFLALDQIIRPLALMPQLAFVQNACDKANIPLSEPHHDSFSFVKRLLAYAFLRVTLLNRLFPVCRSI